ncbi:hypothetical protein C0J52_07310 [Blattella germanica]|nr:hypothetical protein C0J52_07310 [Blattella germanica]
MSDSHFKDKLCYKTSKIGENCRVTNNCHLASGLPAYCEKSICRCPLKYHGNSDGTDCIKSANLDEPCANDMECVTENSKCGEVCRCRVNYIQSHRNDSCIEAADSMGDPCQENEQCTMFLLRATCGEDGKCRCETGFHHIPPNSKCHRDLFLGEMCELHEECITQFSECKSGTCQCKQNYKQNREECIFVGSNDGDYASRYSLHLLLFTFLLVYFKG